MSPAEDLRFMTLALGLGRRGLGRTSPNPAVGAVVVRDGVVVGRGWTQPGGRPHAEPEALRRAGDAARGATLYVTLEPCSHHGRSPPCVDAILAAGIARVVSTIEDPNPLVAGQGHARLRAAGVVVDVGLCAGEARWAHAGHIRRVLGGRPHVAVKIAVSADGKAGLAGRKPAPITREAVRARVHLMRAMHDVVLTGIGTVLADDPQLTCRLPGMASRSPVRAVLDGKLRLPLHSRIAQSAAEAPVWVLGAENAAPDAEQALRSLGCEVLRVPSRDARLDLHEVLKTLGGRGVTRVMVEAGPILTTAFLRAGLADELVVCRSGTVRLGAQAIDVLAGLELDQVLKGVRAAGLPANFTLLRSEALGPDTMTVYGCD
ncbi:MAG TPA: bifunctional diaminohydroxyphosphoribosylaminopyrimidine deaminase/5-amino-6-(5-phosphoribosylamino)uracil reductase RibD [Xanthobacteraceae bacterium]|nr:bifunctional diaminohydroxyphosphoribosylaminopyrimidine deaminase/5-amino-6-(5-phosphoribosylamino)uracil reductase RibD [Xanthobacteraceae bacterium]